MSLSRHDDLSLRYVLSVPGGIPAADPAPLVLLMHGRGADANDLVDIAPALDGGYRFVFPNAPRPFEPYPGMTFGYSWFDGLPPTPDSFAASRTILLRFLAEIVDRYPTPKLVISGFSQGGVIALDLGFRAPGPVAGIVCMSGALNEADLPDFALHRARPVLIVHGTEDEMIPVVNARRSRRVLEEKGIEPEYHEYPMGHQVSAESVETVREFIARCCAGG